MTSKTERDFTGSAIQLRPALAFPLATLAELLNRCFEGYFVSIHDTPALLAQRLRIDSIDLDLSRVLTVEDRPAGLIYLSPRGWECRVAGMGVIMSHRRCGFGRQLMEEAIDLTRQRGFRHMVLEVIEQNTPALELYRRLGFVAHRRLRGYQFEDTEASGPSVETLQPIDARAVARLVVEEGEPGLPWQIDAESVVAYTPPSRGFALDDTAFALLSYIDDTTAMIQTFLVRRDARRQGWGRRLLAALRHRFPGRTWKIPARVPEDLGDGFLLAQGFQQLELSQLEMSLDLSSSD